jgi:cytoskeletal protein RodZ
MAEEVPSGGLLRQLALALKNERVKRNLSIDDIGSLVNISAAHIEKLETGDFSFLPPLYVFSYLKKYAIELGIGDESLLAQCRKELRIPDLPHLNRATPDPDAVTVAGRRKVRRMLLAASAVLMLLLAAALLTHAF